MTTHTPKLRFPEFFNKWDEKKLGEITTWTSGGTPSKENAEYWDGDIPWISASSMRGIKYYDSNIKITEKGLKKGSKLTKKGTLLILVRGSMLFNTIPIGLAMRDLAFNQDVKAIEVNEESTSKFILYWFISNEGKVLNMVTGTGIGAGKLDLPDLKALQISLPQLPEQTKIANFLTAIDEKIQALKQKKTLLEQYKKGIMQQIFSQELRFKNDDSSDFDDWEEKSLGEICEVITKGTTPRQFSNQGVKFIKTECFNEKGIDELKCLFVNEEIHNKELKRSILKENDILFAIAGSIGKVRIVKKNILPANTNQALSIIRLKEKEIVRFIFYILTSINMEKYILDNITVGAQPNLNLEQMNNYCFNYPSLPEQQKIADFLTAIDEKIEKVSQQITATETYKKGLLQQMFI